MLYHPDKNPDGAAKFTAVQVRVCEIPETPTTTTRKPGHARLTKDGVCRPAGGVRATCGSDSLRLRRKRRRHGRCRRRPAAAARAAFLAGAVCCVPALCRRAQRSEVRIARHAL